MYFVGLILTFVKMPAFMKSRIMFLLMTVAVIPVLLMAVGIVELINERIHKLDRIQPQIRLFRAFGALTLGGITGTVIAAVMLLCGIFAGPLFKLYRRKGDTK